MPPRSPSVRAAIATVSRRMRVRRAPLQSSATTTPSTPNCLFVSPVLNAIHSELISLSASSLLSVPETSYKESFDLSQKLRSLLQVNNEAVVASTSASTTTLGKNDVTKVNAKNDENIKVNGSHIHENLLVYKPFLDATILRRVAAAVDIDGALQRTQNFVRAIRDGGDFWSILSKLREMHPQPPTMQELELQSGIAARLYHGSDGRRESRLSAFRLHVSDVQVSEILPNGKIVTFISPTLPSVIHVDDFKSVQSNWMYLHFVLYKVGMTLTEVFHILSEVTQGMCLPEHFAVNLALEESAVTTQVCSLYLPLHDSIPYEKYRVMIMKKILQINLKPVQLSLQLLGWRPFPCSPLKSSSCQMQYSMLLRGIAIPASTGRKRLEGKVLGKLSLFPNFFGPHHFGLLSPFSVFRSYHALAAWERNMPAEALVIAASLSESGGAKAKENSWIHEMIKLLQKGEERPAVLKEWYHLHVPCGLRAQIEKSKSTLLWNILASCRIHKLGRNSIDGLPEPGEWVVEHKDGGNRNVSPGIVVEKPELFPDNSLWNAPRDHYYGGVKGSHYILTKEEATSYTLRDVLLPLNLEENEVINELSQFLGFSHSSYCTSSCKDKLHYTWNPVYFRSLFSAGTGHPHTAHPWVRTLPEPNNVMKENEDAVYRLLTDMELGQGGTSYTARSRGQPRGIWPIGKYGYKLGDRLPAGALALEISDTIGQESINSLALHFTLPAETYSMAFLREFIMIEDHTRLTPCLHNMEKHRSNMKVVKEKDPMTTRENENIVGGANAATTTPSYGELVDGDILGIKRIMNLKQRT